jgi:hypothetical protein
MPRTLFDAPPPVLGDITEYKHLVTVYSEECERDDCYDKAEAEREGDWLAACGHPQCDFLVEAPVDHHDALWQYAERHEADPQVGLGVDELPTDVPESPADR